MAAAQRCEHGEGPLRVAFDEGVLSPEQRAEVLDTLSLSLRVRHEALEEGPRAGGAAVRIMALSDARLGIQLTCATDPVDGARETLAFDPRSLDEEVVAFALARAIDEVLQHARLVGSMDPVFTELDPSESSPSESDPSELDLSELDPSESSPSESEADERAPEQAPAEVARPHGPVLALRFALGPSVRVFSTETYQLGGRAAVSLRIDRLVIGVEILASTAPTLAVQHGALAVSSFGGALVALGRAVADPFWWLDVGAIGSIAAVVLDATAETGWTARDAVVPAVGVGGRMAVGGPLAGALYAEGSLDVEAVVLGADAYGGTSLVRIDGVAFTLGVVVGGEV